MCYCTRPAVYHGISMGFTLVEYGTWSPDIAFKLESNIRIIRLLRGASQWIDRMEMRCDYDVG